VSSASGNGGPRDGSQRRRKVVEPFGEGVYSARVEKACCRSVSAPVNRARTALLLEAAADKLIGERSLFVLRSVVGVGGDVRSLCAGPRPAASRHHPTRKPHTKNPAHRAMHKNLPRRSLAARCVHVRCVESVQGRRVYGGTVLSNRRTPGPYRVSRLGAWANLLSIT